MKHYIYVGLCGDGVVRYVGKGKDSRYLHISSGRSSCYEANKYIIYGGAVQSHIVLSGLTEDVATSIEACLIDVLQPEWNIILPTVNDSVCETLLQECINNISNLTVPFADVNYEDDVTTLSELKECCRYDLEDMKEDAGVTHEGYCFEKLDIIGAVSFNKWYKLSKLIQRRNTLCIDLSELMSVVGFVSKSKFSEWVKQVRDAGMLLVSYPEGTKSQRRVVYFNPHLVWKGSYRVRGRYRYLWNKMKGIDR